MIAVTIGVGTPYEEMAHCSAVRIRALTGLQTHVLGADSVRKWVRDRDIERWGAAACTILKFHLFDIFSNTESILYFDADIVYLRKWDPRQFSDAKSFISVRDHWFHPYIQAEADRAGIPADAYFNIGFFIASRKHHARFLRAALGKLDFVYDISSSLFEQTALNKTLHDLRVPMLYLDRRFNFMAWSPDGEAACKIPAIAAHKPFIHTGNGDLDITMQMLRRPSDENAERDDNLDEKTAATMRGSAVRVRHNDLEEYFLELRADHTVINSFPDYVYWYVFRDTSKPRLVLFSRDHVTCELQQDENGCWC